MPENILKILRFVIYKTDAKHGKKVTLYFEEYNVAKGTTKWCSNLKDAQLFTTCDDADGMRVLCKKKTAVSMLSLIVDSTVDVPK